MVELSNIFVFGSNLAGRHGAGSALHAKEHHGAVYGVGKGLTGNSYAIPTKDENLQVLHLPQISIYIQEFISFARSHPEMTFDVTKIGCALAGYSQMDIAPMFRNAPSNCNLPEYW